MPELTAAVIGVLCGVAAAIPVSLLLVVLWCKLTEEETGGRSPGASGTP